MRQVFRALLVLSCLLPAASRVAGRQALPPAGVEELRKRLQRSFSGVAAPGEPGFALLVKQAGRVLFEQAAGVRDLRGKSPIDGQTNFRLASCTKQFTAMAVMLLVHDKQLRYEDRLTDLFPGFPEYGRAITVRHLLTHTSGLPGYEDLMDATWTPTHQIQDQDVLDLLKRQTHG